MKLNFDRIASVDLTQNDNFVNLMCWPKGIIDQVQRKS